MKSDLGDLLLSLVYNENLSRLTATVIEARRLKVRKTLTFNSAVLKGNYVAPAVK